MARLRTAAVALLGFSVLNIFLLQSMQRTDNNPEELKRSTPARRRSNNQFCVQRCIKDMLHIHECIQQKRSCNADNYKSCLLRCGIQQDAYSLLVSARHGKFMVNLNDIYIGASLLFYGEWSDEEIDLMKLNLPADGVVVDVGANIGAMTVPLAKHVKQGMVVAFEPQRVINQLLGGNVQLNSLANVHVRRAACGQRQEADGSERVHVPEISPFVMHNFGGLSLESTSGGSSPTALNTSKVLEMVGLESLDDLDLARLDLLKIDAQGMEQGVLLGARHTIRKHLPVIYMEYESSSPKLFKLIKSLGGYKCYSHAPRLYKDSNFRGEKINIFGQIRSFNVYCVAKSSMKVPDWLRSNDLDSISLPSISHVRR